MEKVRQAATIAAAVVLIGLGILNLVYRDSLLSWQPTPENAPWKLPFALVSGLLLIAGGAGLLLARWRALAAGLAAIWVGLWALLLHVPHILAEPNVGSLLGLAETTFMALGLATLTGWFDSSRRALFHRIGLGLCLIAFGASHFVYADFTAAMVPSWLPQRLGFAYLTGAIHALMGACLLVGVRVRMAAMLEAIMMSSFVLLVHIPGVALYPQDRMQLTMLGMASLLTSAAWLVTSWRGLGHGLSDRR
jgi:uncharacterized membrane protein